MPENDPNVVEQLEAPMPWIGMYAAVASTLCTLAMAADVFHGFRSRKYWFPSKYLSLNATSLALLSVAMKLPVDLTTKMYSVTDRLAKVSSLSFISIVMANFLTSLGSMDDKSLLMNVVALGIMVITITGNVCIQVIQMRSYLDLRRAFWEESVAMGLMLLLLLMFISSALTILSTKQFLETRYHDMHNSILNEEELVDITKKLRVLIKKYWVMAETSSPQFVMARSVTSTVSGIVSLIVAFNLVEAEIRIAVKEGIFDHAFSSYKQSTRVILLSQTVGVIVGAIAPTSRWFVAINHRTSTGCRRSIQDAFTVEGYWTQKLVEWRQSSLSVEIQHLKSRKVLHGLRGLILRLGIFVQHLIVMASKLVLSVSICTMRLMSFCLNYIRRSRQKHICDSNSDSGEVDMRRYVIQLQGEAELPAETLSNIFKEVDEIIRKAKKRKPEKLLNLLSKSCNFKGVTEFDSHQVPTLHPQELPHCWALPVVTLACIARAIPNVEKEKSERLLRSVTEGLRYVKLMDKLLDRKGQLAKTRAAAEAVSVEAELKGKWQNRDLDEISIKGKNAEEILQQLHEDSGRRVLEFKRNPKNSVTQNLVYWSPEVIAANSMYRVSKAILLNHGGGEHVFETLSVMIADIVAACLTNLPWAISSMCHRSGIEERERGVRKAAKYLGETEDIIALIQQRQLPILGLPPHRPTYIQEWRALLGLQNQNKDHISINIEE
ncbi:uncharacterized protein LOC130990781 [Salvia miltiorrhiza]|uniref:uncharacterized protein LOC130990781 n=1 Tax=Salvia miltiorrhiza TaxID=226208 RepID=UPI0025ABB9BC|nr:uncharacterized protein LOC130990781 [Salvia miltiorrhiza]